MNNSKEIGAWVAEIKGKWENPPVFKVDPERIQHVAIICDGNRRAAVRRELPPYIGHQAGIETVKAIASCAREWGIGTLTFWLWSTENWERERQQVDFMFYLSRQTLQDKEFLSQLIKDQVRFKHLGRKDRLPNDISQSVGNIESQTVGFGNYRLNLGIDYGGLDEVIRAIKRLKSDGSIVMEEILSRPEALDRYLDTAGQPLVDLVVRTGVRSDSIYHMSGFMPLQTRQAGLAFLPDLFPELTPQVLLQSLRNYQSFEQRFGR